MSESETRVGEWTEAAAQVASDPAFAALQAAGAPVIAAAGDPPRIVFMNAAALAVFETDGETLGERLFHSDAPTAQRLSELMRYGRRGAAPRLERLHFPLDDETQTVTVLCRNAAAAGGESYFIMATLGLRPSSDDADDPETKRKTGFRRFLWRTDAQGKFIGASHVLEDVVGKANADILGRDAIDVARTLGLDPDGRFVRALAQRKSWSGIEVEWPLEKNGTRVTVGLGGLPIFDDDQRFAGFRGYGVFRLENNAAPSNVSPAATPPELPAPGSEPLIEYANVVPLRPLNGQLRQAESRKDDDVLHVRPPSETAQDNSEDALTPSEQSAFEEIARALAASGESAPAKGSVRDLMEIAFRASEGVDDSLAGQDGGDAATRHALAMLDRLPIGVLVCRGFDALYANRTLLNDLGYADLPALERDGGLGRAFCGRAPDGDSTTEAARMIEVMTRRGEKLSVDARLQSIDWDDGPAALITLRPSKEITREGPNAAELQAALDTISDAIAILDGEGRIRAVNRGFVHLFGVDATILPGQTILSLISGHDHRAIADRLASLAANEVETAPSLATGEAIQVSGRTRAGVIFPAELTIRRISSGADKRICVALRDLTHRRRSDKEIDSARVEAERASAAKSDFLAKVSHEIRTPLNAILGFAEVMMEEQFGPIGNDRYKEYLRDIHVSGAHVLSLVNDLLDLSKIEAGKMELEFERIDINAVVGECASIMQTQASRARVVMRLSLAPRLPRIRADRRSLKQILLNLLSNAVKFNQPGGQVIVSSALTDAGYVMLRVKDTGVGMSNDEIQTALQPFRQLAATREVTGTGLGLPVTKALIEANHASFTIKSRKNEGTLIEIAFAPPQVLAAE